MNEIALMSTLERNGDIVNTRKLNKKSLCDENLTNITSHGLTYHRPTRRLRPIGPMF